MSEWFDSIPDYWLLVAAAVLFIIFAYCLGYCIGFKNGFDGEEKRKNECSKYYFTCHCRCVITH